jgi:hypothetical protein
MAQWALLETSMWVNIQRITGVAHCANVVWPDLVSLAVYGSEKSDNWLKKKGSPTPLRILTP